MSTMVINEKDRFLLNMEGQDFSEEAKGFIKLRERALSRLKEQDFPNKKEEDWKYTSVRELSKSDFKPQSPVNLSLVDAQKHYIPGLQGPVLVFVNGFYQAKLSRLPEELQEGLVVCNLNEAKKEYLPIVDQYLGAVADEPELFFANVNGAFSQDGGFVLVKKGVEVEGLVHILHLTDGELVSTQPRNLIVAEENAKVAVVSTYETLSEGSSFTNAVTEVFVAKGANVVLDKIQNEHEGAINVSIEQVQVEKDATFTINTIPVGGKIIRNNLKIALTGSGAEGNLYGAMCLNGNMHVDNQTFVEHVEPHCESNELYKAVVNDKATNIFNGKILVHQKAQKTNAFQSNGNILVSDDATVNAKPQLEIYADDVKCSHGCTIGQFDDEALFYLRARGIRKEKAQEVLLEAFVGEALANLSSEEVKNYTEALLYANFQSKQ